MKREMVYILFQSVLISAERFWQAIIIPWENSSSQHHVSNIKDTGLMYIYTRRFMRYLEVCKQVWCEKSERRDTIPLQSPSCAARKVCVINLVLKHSFLSNCRWEKSDCLCNIAVFRPLVWGRLYWGIFIRAFSKLFNLFSLRLRSIPYPRVMKVKTVF